MRFLVGCFAFLASLAVAGAASATTVNFRTLGTFTTPLLLYTGGSANGSANVNIASGTGLGVVGGASSTAVDTAEFVEFHFTAPSASVSYSIAFCSASGAPCGSRTLEAFGVGGVSLGTVSQSSIGGFSLSTFFGDAIITGFRLTSNAAISQFVVGSLTFQDAPPAIVPLPAALPLFLAGLAGLGFAHATRRRQPG